MPIVEMHVKPVSYCIYLSAHATKDEWLWEEKLKQYHHNSPNVVLVFNFMNKIKSRNKKDI
jgi:hypothetical protein